MTEKQSCRLQREDVTWPCPSNADCDLSALKKIPLYFMAHICVWVRAGGGWGHPHGKNEKLSSAVGSPLAASGLILVGSVIHFML